MPDRFTDAEIREIKSISLEVVLRERGFHLQKQGSSLKMNCPFHEDKTASLSINTKSNLWKCFGCGMGGSNIDFLMRQGGLSFVESVNYLKEQHFLIQDSLKSLSTPTKEDQPETIFSPENQKVLKEFVNSCHQQLLKNPQVLNYLESRKLKDSGMLKEFKIGYCDKMILSKLPTRHTKEGQEIRSRYKRLGLMNTLGVLLFAGYILFPIYTEEGLVGELSGRKLYPNPGEDKHRYMPGPHHGMFNVKCLIEKEIILCESVTDALSFWCYRFKNVTSSFGSQGFTDEQVNLFLSHAVERVYIAYDNDDGGNLGSEKVISKLSPHKIECIRVIPTDKMDINEYICQSENPESALTHLLNKPSPSSVSPEVLISPLAVDSASNSASQRSGRGDGEGNPASISPLAADSKKGYTERGEDLYFTFGSREYQVKGVYKNLSSGFMKVYLRVSMENKVHRDNNVDLFHFKSRMVLVSAVSDEFNLEESVIKKDIEKISIVLEDIQNQLIDKTLEPERKEVILSEREIESANEYRRKPRFLERVARDIQTCGFVGETSIIKVIWLSTLSRMLSQPLNIMLYSASSSGKSTIVNKVLRFLPDEDKVEYSAITGQALYYMPEDSLAHKTLYIAEVGGFERALYALKLLLSEGKLSLASVGPDPKTGQNIPIKSYVRGPVNAIFTVPDDYHDEELQSRCLVLTLDESREQTRRIHEMQRKMRSLEGTALREEVERLTMLHKNIQRLIKPMPIYNPYVKYLTFTNSRNRTRRDHVEYLTLIDCHTLAHQLTRPRITKNENGVQIEHIRVTLEDISESSHLANEVMGTSLDILPPQTRKLLHLIEEVVLKSCTKGSIDKSEYRFSRRDLRDEIGWGDTQLKVHLSRLVDYEYLLLHKRDQRYYYELLYNGEGKDGKRFILGLSDVETIKAKAIADGLKFEELFENAKLETQDSQIEILLSGRGAVGGRAGCGRGGVGLGGTAVSHVYH